MAGSAGRRERREQGQGANSPAMPPVMGPPAPADSVPLSEALSGVFPRVARVMFPGIRNLDAVSTPQARQAQAAAGQDILGTAAGLAGATAASEEAFARADALRAEGPAATRSTRGQTPAPAAQTQGQALTEVALPPLTQRQVRANAAAQLSQYNVAELAALQGILPTRPEPVSVEEQVRQTLFDNATANYLRGTAPGASVEEAAAAETAFIQQLMQILDPNPLLMPTE